MLLGIPAPHCADQWCSDSCPLEAKHTDTQYLTWFNKSPTSTGESPYYQRQIEKGLQRTWRRRITSLKLNSHGSHTAAQGSRAAALGNPSLFLLFSYVLFSTLSLLSQNMPLLQAILGNFLQQQQRDNRSRNHATNCGISDASTKPQLVVGYCH